MIAAARRALFPTGFLFRSGAACGTFAAMDSAMLDSHAAPRPDGRQSPTALAVQRGTCRFLRDLGFASLCEVSLADGRRADILALSPQGEVWIVEIKSSIADFRADAKWRDYRAWCDRFHFAAPPEIKDIFPEGAGLVVADRFAAFLLREAPERRLAPARRRAVTLRFAQVAALRLQTLGDPGCV